MAPETYGMMPRRVKNSLYGSNYDTTHLRLVDTDKLAEYVRKNINLISY